MTLLLFFEAVVFGMFVTAVGLGQVNLGFHPFSILTIQCNCLLSAINFSPYTTLILLNCIDLCAYSHTQTIAVLCDRNALEVRRYGHPMRFPKTPKLQLIQGLCGRGKFMYNQHFNCHPGLAGAHQPRLKWSWFVTVAFLQALRCCGVFLVSRQEYQTPYHQANTLQHSTTPYTMSKMTWLFSRFLSLLLQA